MPSQTMYQRPVHCKYCDKLFDFPTYTLDVKEKDIPVRTRICRDCLWEMAHDDALLERRQASSQHPSETRTTQSPQISVSEISTGYAQSDSATETPNTSSRPSTDATEDKDPPSLGKTKLSPDSQNSTLPERRGNSDIHTLLN